MKSMDSAAAGADSSLFVVDCGYFHSSTLKLLTNSGE